MKVGAKQIICFVYLVAHTVDAVYSHGNLFSFGPKATFFFASAADVLA